MVLSVFLGALSFLGIASWAAEPPSLAGYLVVTSNTSRSVQLLDPNLGLSKMLWVGPEGAQPWGVTRFDQEHILVSIFGQNRVLKINLYTGDSTTYLTGTHFNGMLRGLTQVPGGDLFVADNGANDPVERYTERYSPGAPVRLAGQWMRPAMQAITQLSNSPLPYNSYVGCSQGSQNVAVFDGHGRALATADATSPLPTLGTKMPVTACVTSPFDGSIAAAYSGRSSSVRVYDPYLTITKWTFQDLVLLPKPAAITTSATGNWLAIDQSGKALELSVYDGQLLRIIETPYLNGINQALGLTY